MVEYCCRDFQWTGSEGERERKHEVNELGVGD